MMKEINLKVVLQRYNLNLNNKQVELQNFNPISQNAPQLSIPLGLLSRKQKKQKIRKCKKCSELIFTLKPRKKLQKICLQCLELHYDHALYLQADKVQDVNKEKTELQVVIQMFNKSKYALKYSFQPLDSQILEQYNLITIKNLPSPTFTFNNENIKSDISQYQKFEAILVLKRFHENTVCIFCDSQNKIPLDLQQLNYNVNVQNGTL
ncbi:unnamed protein product [Paramecium octaurelia]|uniref:Uncharacterized protein n=1 Tax=Paramecium octaurelia TaxID=43137 RepID=A0A8S1RWG4_PAROT|nr:unnamed protein product [Paramecium octaurelia]